MRSSPRKPQPVSGGYAPAIKSARHRILVSAREISSRKLLEALRTRAIGGVDVEFLLSPDVDNRGTIRWITENKAGRVYVDSQPLGRSTFDN